jgi:hypothetical protein
MLCQEVFQKLSLPTGGQAGVRVTFLDFDVLSEGAVDGQRDEICGFPDQLG